MTNKERIARAQKEAERAAENIEHERKCSDCTVAFVVARSGQRRCPPCTLLDQLESIKGPKSCAWCGDRFMPHRRDWHLCAPCQGAEWWVRDQGKLGHYGEKRKAVSALVENRYDDSHEDEAEEHYQRALGAPPKARPRGCAMPVCVSDRAMYLVRENVDVCVYCASSIEHRPEVVRVLRHNQIVRRTGVGKAQFWVPPPQLVERRRYVGEPTSSYLRRIGHLHNGGSNRTMWTQAQVELVVDLDHPLPVWGRDTRDEAALEAFFAAPST